ncbi:MAG: hypothetical protein ACLFWH_01890 [Actinomycetota bacterium]
MRKLLERTRLAMAESNNMGKLLTLPNDDRAVVVYAEDTFSYIQLKGYLRALWVNHGVPYQYVTSAPDDPLLEDPPPGATTWFIREQLARMMSSLECGIFITTMPDLGNFQVPRPKSGRALYVFHSLNSTHTAYRSGAFDNYDQFMCTGPHHIEELGRLRPDSNPVLSEVGYYKLDLIREEHADWLERDAIEEDLVLLAPSWGRHNLLEAHGSEIIASLVTSGFRVIVRPHPQFFHSLYPEGAGVIGRLQEEFGVDHSVEFELNIDSQDSFHRSALMISDWSGAAYEYALGTHRRVLFIDTPQKIFNPGWEQIGLASFEGEMRDQVGEVLATDSVHSTGNVAYDVIRRSRYSRSDLAELASQKIFNLDESARVGAEVIADTLSRS